MGFSDLFSCPFTCAPVKDQSFADEPIKGSAGFFNGSFNVWAMAEADIDVVLLKPL
jgi:hypothetical protein